jgi:hypothetical protein
VIAVAASDCVVCELERMLRARSTEIRDELRVLNPNTEPNYERLFQVLIDVDQDLRMLKGRMRRRRADA